MSSHNNLSIYTVFHKEYPVPNCSFIIPIQVGAANSTQDLGFLKDNTGDNISGKNSVYCELTALYWIWKNIDNTNSDYIGLSHYRRYFTVPRIVKKKKLFFKKRQEDKAEIYNEVLNDVALNKVCSEELKEALLKGLNEGNIIVPKSLSLEVNGRSSSIKTHYIFNHVREDWTILEETVHELFPEYKEAINQLDVQNKMYGYNMFIADKNFVRAYCSWLFKILFALEKKVKLSEYTYQRRVFGFMSERLINLYIIHNKISVKEFPVVFFE